MTNPDSMVEKVARALVDRFDAMTAEDRDYWLYCARAAIAAMREPTKGMTEAAELELLVDGPGDLEQDDAGNFTHDSETVAIVWGQMIDAALEGK